MAAPLVAVLGLPGSLIAAGVLAASCAVVVALPRRSRGRHHAGRIEPLAEPVAA